MRINLNVNSCGHDDKVPHELPCPTSFITPPVHHSRPPVMETEPRFSDYRSNNTAFMPAVKPTAGFRCRAVAQLGNSANLGISVGGNIGKGCGDDESHTRRHIHIGDKGSQTVIRSHTQRCASDRQRHPSGQPKPQHRTCARHRRLPWQTAKRQPADNRSQHRNQSTSGRFKKQLEKVKSAKRNTTAKLPTGSADKCYSTA